MKYLKLYEDYESPTFVNKKIVNIAKYYDKNFDRVFRNGWDLDVMQPNIISLPQYMWSKGKFLVYANPFFTNNFSIKILLYYNMTCVSSSDSHPIKYGKYPNFKTSIPETNEELKEFFDWYFNELMPDALYFAENKDKIDDFIKCIVDQKGIKGEFKINDTINGYFIKSINKNSRHNIYSVCFKEYEVGLDVVNYKILVALYKYLQKKYPEMAVGKEWGFFDLERSEK